MIISSQSGRGKKNIIPNGQRSIAVTDVGRSEGQAVNAVNQLDEGDVYWLTYGFCLFVFWYFYWNSDK